MISPLRKETGRDVDFPQAPWEMQIRQNKREVMLSSCVCVPPSKESSLSLKQDASDPLFLGFQEGERQELKHSCAKQF